MIEERLYSTGNDDLDYILEKAFCEGYEYAQREFGSHRQEVAAIKAKVTDPIRQRAALEGLKDIRHDDAVKVAAYRRAKNERLQQLDAARSSLPIEGKLANRRLRGEVQRDDWFPGSAELNEGKNRYVGNLDSSLEQYTIDKTRNPGWLHYSKEKPSNKILASRYEMLKGADLI